jgi:hypothetical protein
MLVEELSLSVFSTPPRRWSISVILPQS